jgi:purine-binding chemotaxis protein CheW
VNSDKKNKESAGESQDSALDPKSIQTLKSRARDLAEVVLDEGDSEKSLEIVEFSLAYERYGIESVYVREVYPMKEFTVVPCTPPFVLGIINVRGQVMSVVDIRRFFELPIKGLTDLNRVVIVQSNRMEMGILADRIVGVRPVPLSSIQSTLPTLTGVRNDYLRGVTNDRSVILDVEKMLNDRRFYVNEEVE